MPLDKHKKIKKIKKNIIWSITSKALILKQKPSGEILVNDQHQPCDKIWIRTVIHLFAANIVSLHCLSVTQTARICSLQVGRIRIYINDATPNLWDSFLWRLSKQSVYEYTLFNAI